MRRCLVVGCGPDAWAEVAEAEAMADFDAVICVKDAGLFWPRGFDTWATLHPEWQADFDKRRAAAGMPAPAEVVAPLEAELCTRARAYQPSRRVSFRWPGMRLSGSSGLYAVKIAVDDGADRVVLAGVPMTGEPNVIKGKPWKDAGTFRPAWDLAMPFINGKVRSMSGWTMDRLGRPDRDWLA